MLLVLVIEDLLKLQKIFAYGLAVAFSASRIERLHHVLQDQRSARREIGIYDEEIPIDASGAFGRRIDPIKVVGREDEYEFVVLRSLAEILQLGQEAGRDEGKSIRLFLGGLTAVSYQLVDLVEEIDQPAARAERCEDLRGPRFDVRRALREEIRRAERDQWPFQLACDGLRQERLGCSGRSVEDAGPERNIRRRRRTGQPWPFPELEQL